MGKKKGAKAGRAKQKQKVQRSGGGDQAWMTSTRHAGIAFGDEDDNVNDDDNNGSHVMFRGFGGATTRHFGPINPAIKLRHQAVAFISAGTSMPIELEPSISANGQQIRTPDATQADIAIEPTPLASPSAVVAQTEILEIEIASEPLNSAPQSYGMDGANDTNTVSEGQALQYMIDTTGDLTIQPATSNNTAIHRALSPTPSSSSEEVVVFRGRNKAAIVDDPIHAPLPTTILAPHDRRQVSGKAMKTSITQPATSDKSHNLKAQASSRTVEPDTTWKPAEPGAWWRKENNTTSTSKKETREDTTPPLIIAHVEQMARKGAELTTTALQAEYMQTQREKQQARNGNRAKNTANRAKRHQMLSKREKQECLREQSLLQSLDVQESDSEDAAYRDYIENTKAQVDDSDAAPDGDARLQVELEVSDAIELNDATEWEDTDIGDDESEELLGQDFDEVYGRLVEDAAIEQDSSELEDELGIAEREILEAEDELRAMRMRSLTDEQLARLYAKQAELGINSDELILDDGEIAYVDDGEGFGDVNAARSGLADYMALGRSSKHRSSRPNRRRQQDRAFPDASALADAVEQYGNDGFDIMDLDRPSLRATKKGRKGKMPAELEALSDEELKDNMRNAWDNDRAKKRLKKAEREELRAQGLLGALGKKGKADFDEKYRQGMNLSEIRVELATFLQDDDQTTRSFPPMDKTDRKALHEIANKLGLKSKSIGTGNSRAPVLYKTRSTADYSEAAMNRAMRVANKHFLRNQSFHGEVAKKGAASLKRSGGSAYTGLRHGEVVGAGAKEIGKDNFGSKLMEKMGWTRGTALGKDGEGVLHPVEQMMRVGKAGLG